MSLSKGVHEEDPDDGDGMGCDRRGWQGTNIIHHPSDNNYFTSCVVRYAMPLHTVRSFYQDARRGARLGVSAGQNLAKNRTSDCSDCSDCPPLPLPVLLEHVVENVGSVDTRALAVGNGNSSWFYKVGRCRLPASSKPGFESALKL